MLEKIKSEEKCYSQFGNMSRLAKKPIVIPSGVEVKKDGNTIKVKGPKGTLTKDFRDGVTIEIGSNDVTVSYTGSDNFLTALTGTYASHIMNMIEGVTNGYTKKLILEGVGYKVALQGKELVLEIGFSHSVKLAVPEGLDVIVEKNDITISGFDKELVGSFSAKVRAQKKAEPYKGKGLHYEGEVVRRKQGKKTVA